MRLMEKTAAYSATDAMDAWIIFDTRRANKRVWKLEVTSGTVALLIEGRISDGTWATVVSSQTADADGVLDAFPYMRVRFTAASSFVGYLDMDADGRKLAGFSADRTDS
jgi:hypothetical protein